MVNYLKQNLSKKNLQFPNNLLAEHFRGFNVQVIGVEKEIDHPNTVKNFFITRYDGSVSVKIYAGQITRNVGLEKFFW